MSILTFGEYLDSQGVCVHQEYLFFCWYWYIKTTSVSIGGVEILGF